MKFSDINQEEWAELKPYLDTCLLPFTRLTGLEQPWEITHALEKLRDVMDLVEQPFHGRVVTYPAVHYKLNEEQDRVFVQDMCQKIRESGFRHIIVITVDQAYEQADIPGVDLFLTSEHLQIPHEEIMAMVEQMWKRAVPHLEK